MQRAALLGLVTLISAWSAAHAPAAPREDRNQSRYWFGSGTVVMGQDVIGSEDVRRGGMYGIGYARPEPRFTFQGNRAQIAGELYYMFTRGYGYEFQPVDHLHNWGLTVRARYWQRWIRGMDTYLDLGWGLSYGNKRTVDMDARLNSTPFIGVGTAVSFLRSELHLGVRWWHMSNAGLVGNNQGHNSIQYVIAYRF